jgi:hypothetical protein
MPDQSALKNKLSNYFDEKKALGAHVSLHKWLLISACVLIFVVLPLLFIWSSLKIIHTPGYEQNSLFLDVGSVNNSA